MKSWCSKQIAVGLLLMMRLTAFTGPFQTVSAPDPTLVSVAAGGDSFAPTITPDARFILFTSTAANLITNINGSAITTSYPATLNVFLRDRTTAKTTLVSANQSGLNGGNDDSVPSEISTNGQFALFESSASDLVSLDTNNATDIFLRDTINNTTTLISISTKGDTGNGFSRSAVMTPDGRYVAFVSAANNLVSNDTNNIPDIFLRDTVAGTTTIVSAGATGTSTSCESPEISPDGRYIAFFSTATNLVPSITNQGEIYLADTLTGTITCPSVDAHAIVTTNLNISTTTDSYDHCLSADGQFVAYQASVTNSAATTVPNGFVLRYNVQAAQTDIIDTNSFVGTGPLEDIRTIDMTPDGRFVAYVAYLTNQSQIPTFSTCIKVWDSQSGTSTVVSVDSNNNVPAAAIADCPVIDPTGRFVAFICNTNLTGAAIVAGFHAYVRDLQSNTTSLIDVNNNGIATPFNQATLLRMSADAQSFVFSAADSAILAGDNNRGIDVLMSHLSGNTVELISARDATLPSTTANGASAISPWCVSSDGRYVTFSSVANNLVPGDNNTNSDIFVRDLLTGTTTLISTSTNGHSANAPSTEPSISADGRFVAFASYASDIVPIGVNTNQHVYLVDRQTGAARILSRTAAGVLGNGPSYSPLISSDGKRVLYRSRATNVSTNGTGSGELLLLSYVDSSNNLAVVNNLIDDAMTRDGRYVACSTTVSMYVRDTQTAAFLYANSSYGANAKGIAICANGSRFCYLVTNTLFDVTIAGASSAVPTAAAGPFRITPHYTADGRLLAFCTSTDVKLYDTTAKTTVLISHAYNDTTTPANGVSDSPDISADGRYVVYRSTASNLVENLTFADTNGWPRLYLYDTQTGSNSIFSVSQTQTPGGNPRAQSPAFTPDGRSVVFSSRSSDLDATDFNQSSDIFEFAFLYATVVSSSPDQGTTISWPAAPGQTYHVQYKDNVDDPTWQILTGTIVINGNRASITDTAASSDQRIYRVAAF